MTRYHSRYMTGTCQTGHNGTAGKLNHAVPEDAHKWSKALCGAKPGDKGNGWSDFVKDTVTCSRCLRKLNVTSNKG